MLNPMTPRIDEQAFLRGHSKGQTTATIGAAMMTLNALGYVIGLDGTIEVAGERVALRVERGAVVAVVDGTTIPWPVFAQALKARPA